jgi:hypothetical protein
MVRAQALGTGAFLSDPRVAALDRGRCRGLL